MGIEKGSKYILKWQWTQDWLLFCSLKVQCRQKKTLNLKIPIFFFSRSLGFMNKHYKHNIPPWSVWLTNVYTLYEGIAFLHHVFIVKWVKSFSSSHSGPCLIDPWPMIHPGCTNICLTFPYSLTSTQLTSLPWRIRWMKSSRWAEREESDWAWNRSIALSTELFYLYADCLFCNPR